MKKITNITELKYGMKVRGFYCGRVFYDGFIYTDSNEDFFIRSAEIFQDIDISEQNLNNHSLQLFTIDDNELVVREGDVIYSKKYDATRYVLGVTGCVALLSDVDDCHIQSFLRTFQELYHSDYKLVTDKPETIQIDVYERTFHEVDGKTYKKSDIDNLTPIN